ncbi:MAG: signal peptidase II [Rhodospirillales bacterium]|nr:MAG: signal peptidase II [Rhodospirillales bacterium]
MRWNAISRRPSKVPRIPRPARAFRPGLAVAAVIIALDQLSKWWIVHRVMDPPRVIEVTPFFNLVMTWNPGVSFGLFREAGAAAAWLLPTIAAVVVAALLVWLYRIERLFLGMALAFIIGGAVGNVIDRILYGAVADFLDFHVMGFHWPAFNLADTMITIGAVMVVADALLAPGHKR